ncbi:1-acyl-sn-glycerol-3-phosphate acyltransferase [Marinobacterium sp. D7]|uniref:lysophospholipid acyltransferase family protein n=1 Tax=Marinobacterium ramblicola TaxID=2849041 RepID=UPI001C2DE1D5|nr:lysophospholipid acyltransferase family protein [Marinobacterium ramblicola]MBV1790309.1 1-acyl-sn-glycerol-3-phosphate acyltransferase [Marinobacterium ramblicola]
MAQRSTPLLWIRAAIYYLGFYPVTIVYAALCLLIGPLLPFRPRFAVLSSINYFYIAWLRVCCGVWVEVEGRELLPTSGAFVVVANHQSEWETLYLQLLVRPQVVVLKRELLKIPFFGWALALLRPIALDRSDRRGALRQLLEQGVARLKSGLPVLIFPQGTRVPAGKIGRMNKGGAMLAAKAQVPIVPLVHNAGLFWPGKSFIKYPGTVQVRVGPPIPADGRSVDELHAEMALWMEQAMREIGAID